MLILCCCFQDITYLDEMSHFDRERIPERVVHAKGAGMYVCMYIYIMYVCAYVYIKYVIIEGISSLHIILYLGNLRLK